VGDCKTIPPPKPGSIAETVIGNIPTRNLPAMVARLKKTRRPYYPFGGNVQRQVVTRRQALAWLSAELERRQ
jgi:hypothetical protein